MKEKNFEDPQRRVKQEPPVEFVLILPRPTPGWPAIKREKDVKPKLVPLVQLAKFDAKWRSDLKLFKTFHICPHCQLVLNSQGNLTQHLKACSKINPAIFQCEICGEGFPKKWSIRKHMLKHSSEKFFCCTKCGVGFKTNTALLRHSRGKTIYKCAVCDVKFSCYLLLDRHRKDFHGNIFKCDECSYQTKKKDILKQHKGTHNKLFTCETCRKKFSQNQSLKIHQMQHRHGIYATAPEETFACDKCDKSFTTPHYLRAHQKYAHDDEEVKCKFCDKVCKNRLYLLQHSLTHKKVECSICRRMISKCSMTSHLLSHSTENHFKCDLCDYSTKRKGHLKNHIERRHLLKKLVNDFKCRADFSEFERLENLQHKYGSSATTSEKKFECEICKKTFKFKSSLNQHKRKVHSTR